MAGGYDNAAFADHNHNHGRSGWKLPVSLAWRNLRYETTEWTWQHFPTETIRRPKVILRRLNGSVRRNTLNGLLGPSGAGKTSLIRVLIGTAKPALGTEIYLDPIIQHGTDAGLISFVPNCIQESVHGQFTVHDILLYAFRFRNPAVSDLIAERYIRTTIEELMLDGKVLSRKFNRCSGGEQRRVAIAQELMSLSRKPALMFVDEPTTGLDSESALSMIRCLAELAHHQPGMTVVVSIQAPSSETLTLFDQIYVLARGGVCLYSGKPTALRETIQNVLGVTISEDRPAIEECLRIATNGVNDDQVRRLADHILLQEFRIDVSTMNRYQGRIPQPRKRFSFKDLTNELHRLFLLIFWVDWRTLLGMNFCALLFPLILALFCNGDMVTPNGCYPYDMTGWNKTCQQELQDQSLTGTYIVHQLATLLTLTVSVLLFSSIWMIDLLKVFRTEHRNGWYSLGVFFWASQCVFLVQIILFTAIATVTGFFVSGIYSVDNYAVNWNRGAHFLFFNVILAIYLQSHGHIWGTVFLENIRIMAVTLQLVVANLGIMYGLTVSFETMDKPFLVRISNLVGVRHLSNGLIYSFYGLERCDTNTQFSSILQKYFIEPENVYRNVLAAVVNIIVLRTLGFVVLYVKFNVQKNCNADATDHAIFNSIDYGHEPIKQEKSTKISFYPGKPDTAETIEMRNVCRDRILIGWRDLTLFATRSSFYVAQVPPPNNNREKTLILKNLHGQIRFGTMTALMGTSGSGKTSLIKVLNGMMKGRLAGSTKIYLNRYAAIQTCFICQDVSGHLLPRLTARQCLFYASKLKNLVHDSPCIDHERMAGKLLDELDLFPTANTPVEKCSDGQRKRLALALELTAARMPNVILIDEPTSGLDSSTALSVTECLRRLTRRYPEIAIMASIHQPNTELLSLFDQCYVLARDGRCIYSGPPSHIKSYLAHHIPPELTNHRFPIETLIRYSCAPRGNAIVACLAQETIKMVNEMNDDLGADTVLAVDGIPPRRTRFYLKSVAILSHRYLIYTGHNWREWLVFMAVYLAMALSLVYFFNDTIARPSGCMDMDDDITTAMCRNKSEPKLREEVLITNNLNYLAYSSGIFCLTVAIQTMFIFVTEMKFFLNEHRNGWYSSGAFYLQKYLFETATLFPLVLIHVCITDIYESVSPNHYYRWQVIILTLAAQCFQAISHLTVLATRAKLVLMILVLAIFFSSFLMLSNLFNPIAQMSYPMKVLSNFSVLRFINQASFWLVYGGVRCSPDQIQSVLYQLMIPDTWEHFIHCIIMLIALNFLYHLIALGLLILVANPIENRHSQVEKFFKYRQEIENETPTTSFPSVI